MLSFFWNTTKHVLYRFIVLPFVLICLAIFAIIATPTGTRLSLFLLAHPLVGHHWHYQKITGTWLTGLHIHALRATFNQATRLTLHVQDLTFKWRYLALFKGRITIPMMQLKGMQLLQSARPLLTLHCVQLDAQWRLYPNLLSAALHIKPTQMPTPSLHITLTGPPSQYQLHVAWEDEKHARLSLTGHGDMRRYLAINAPYQPFLAGHMQIHGQVGWDEPYNSTQTLQVKAQDLLLPAIPPLHRIHHVHFNANIQKNNNDFAFHINPFYAQIHTKKIQGQGLFSYNHPSQKATFTLLLLPASPPPTASGLLLRPAVLHRLHTYPSYLYLHYQKQAATHQTHTLRWKIKLASLADWSPFSTGRFESQGTLQYHTPNSKQRRAYALPPHILLNGTLQGQDLQWGTATIKHISHRIAFDSYTTRPLRMHTHVKDIHYQHAHIDTFSLHTPPPHYN